MNRMATREHVCAVLAVCLLALAGCGYFRDSGREPTFQAGKAAEQLDFPRMTAEQWVRLSLTRYRERRFLESIAAAQTAAYLQPNYPEAWNNLGASYAELRLWDLAIQAEQQALRLRPDFPLARNNLVWALRKKASGVH